MKKYSSLILLLFLFSGLAPNVNASIPCLPDGNGLWFTLSPLHEYHISKCNIKFSAKEQALQITLHLFIDDLEEALRQDGNDQLYIATEKESADAETYIQAYLEKTFLLHSGQNQLRFTFIGKEKTEDLAAIWCYLEVTKIPPLQELTITNQILMDAFDDQKNIISFQGPNNQRAHFMFQKGKSTDSIQFP